MRTLSLTAALLLAIAGCGKDKPSSGGTEADDLKTLGASKWGIAKIDSGDDKGPPAGFFDTLAIEVKGSLAIAKDDGQEKHGTLKLDPAKSPREIDITQADKDGKPAGDGPDRPAETVKGIYKFEGDTIVIAVASPKVPRPTEFKAVAPEKGNSDSGVFVVTFKKISDDEAAKRGAPKPKPTFAIPSPKKN